MIFDLLFQCLGDAVAADLSWPARQSRGVKYLSDSTAVSYTHLDVYKRQTWESRMVVKMGNKIFVCHWLTLAQFQLVNCRFNNFVFNVPSSAATVSYTHLDVYKRQIPN